jgi:hypothetical protein
VDRIIIFTERGADWCGIAKLIFFGISVRYSSRQVAQHGHATPRHGRPLKHGDFLTSRNSSKMLVPACFRVGT